MGCKGIQISLLRKVSIPLQKLFEIARTQFDGAVFQEEFFRKPDKIFIMGFGICQILRFGLNFAAFEKECFKPVE